MTRWRWLALIPLALLALAVAAAAGWQYGSLHPQSLRPSPDEVYRARGDGFTKGLAQGHKDAETEKETQRELKALRDRDAPKMPQAGD